MKKNYIERLKDKLKIKKIEKNQPINAWRFVLILNLVGFIGYGILRIYEITPGK